MSMDIKVITRHAPSNYGSLLQSIATLHILERLGNDVQIIDYRREDERGFNIIKTHLNNLKEWSGNPIKKLIYILLRYPEELIAERKFNDMRNKYLRMTQEFNNTADMKNLQADIFMTGSDQVWGPMLCGSYDDAYFLEFVKQTKKIAYAASFGRTEFTPEILSKYKAMLAKYDDITVREDSAVEILNGMKIGCRGQVLDPTLLMTEEDWNHLIGTRRKAPNDYILIYQLNNSNVSVYAKQLAEKMKLPLYRITPYYHQVTNCGKMIYLPDVSDFLSYIKNCRCLVTDSFHGTAFALTFKKQFVTVLPQNSTNTRSLSILKLLNLEKQAVTDMTDIDLDSKTINYEIVDMILAQEREKSLKILNNMLKNC